MRQNWVKGIWKGCFKTKQCASATNASAR